MTSIYQRALGAEFLRLHPQIQRRFSLNVQADTAAIGTGTMRQVWCAGWHTWPLLAAGAFRNMMFSQSGENVPFTIANYPVRDELGRENVAWIQTLHSNKPSRSDAYMRFSEQRGCIVDYLGSHENLAIDVRLGIDASGGLHLRSGAQRCYAGKIGFAMPEALSAIVNVHEWFDDRNKRFYVDARVDHPIFGELFGYTGDYTLEWLQGVDIPQEMRPKQPQPRE